MKGKHIVDSIQMKSFLNTIVLFTNEIINELDKGEVPKAEYKKVLYKFVQRFHLNFVVIKNSWQEYLNNSKFRYPFYLLLRSLLSDYILMLYLLDGLKIDSKKRTISENEFIERYHNVSHSYFSKMKRELENQVANKVISSKRLTRILSFEKNIYPRHFEIGNNLNLKNAKELTPGILIKELKKTKFKRFTRIYDFYFYFSQYEHFTEKTVELFGRGRNVELNNITTVFGYLLSGLFHNLMILQIDSRHLQKLEIIIADFKTKFEE